MATEKHVAVTASECGCLHPSYYKPTQRPVLYSWCSHWSDDTESHDNAQLHYVCVSRFSDLDLDSRHSRFELTKSMQGRRRAGEV